MPRFLPLSEPGLDDLYFDSSLEFVVFDNLQLTTTYFEVIIINQCSDIRIEPPIIIHHQ